MADFKIADLMTPTREPCTSNVHPTYGEYECKTRVIKAGDYAGEIVSDCSFQMEIPSITLSKGEAAAIRDGLRIPMTAFHLSADNGVKGIYCIDIKSPAANNYRYDHFKCEWLGERFVDVMVGRLPFTERSRCDLMKEAMKTVLTTKDTTFGEKVWDGLGIGFGFAASATILHVLMNRKNGGGGKGPGDPPAAVGGGGKTADNATETAPVQPTPTSKRVQWMDGLKMVGWGAATVMTGIATTVLGAGTAATAVDPLPGDEIVLGAATAGTARLTATSAAAFVLCARNFLQSIF